MPGPEGPWGEALVKAVRAGDIDESVVDQKVLRILRLAQRVGALDESTAAEPVLVEDGLGVRARGGGRGHRAAGQPTASCRWTPLGFGGWP